MNKTICISVGVLSLLAAGTAYAVPDSCDSGEGAVVGNTSIAISSTTGAGLSNKDFFGRAQVAGDFNGDSIADVAVGANGADDNGGASGTIYVFFGPIAPGGTLDPTLADHVLYGEGGADSAGWTLTNLGDYDGDGRDDLGIGTNPSRYSASYEGRAYAVAGATITAGALNNLTDAADAIFTGDQDKDSFGRSIANAGDFNDDGILDIIVGAPGHNGGAGAKQGAAYVFYGPVSGTIASSTADVKLNGSAAASGFGNSVLGNLDIDGDGISDLVIGASVDDRGGTNAGATMVFLGSPTPAAAYDAVADAHYTTVGQSGGRHGHSLAHMGDFNSDGNADFWTCSQFFGGAKKGRCYAISGADIVTSGSGTAEATYTAALTGENANDLAGSSIVSNFDLNQDGFVDVLIGGERADGATLQSGAAWLMYGPIVGEINLANADAKFSGVAYKDFTGWSVSAGDYNNDTYIDLAIGSYRSSVGGYRRGHVGIVYGGADDADLLTYYADTDLDGFGDLASTTTACSLPAGYSEFSTDCDDT